MKRHLCEPNAMESNTSFAFKSIFSVTERVGEFCRDFVLLDNTIRDSRRELESKSIHSYMSYPSKTLSHSILRLETTRLKQLISRVRRICLSFELFSNTKTL